MQLTSATLLVAGLAVQQASATFPWLIDAGKFSTCSNTDTTCSTEQHKGYDWTGLNIGTPVTSYGANTFSGGWTCNSIKSKRDELTKRTFNSKGSSGFSSNNGAGSLSIGCSGEKNKFSISEMHISSTYNTNVDCHYNMPDGSVCKHSVPCNAGGSVVKNTQCGGAISVSFSHGKPSSGNSNKGDCNLNIHSVGFACGSGSSSTTGVSLPSSIATPLSSAVYVSSEFVSFSTASPETTSSELSPETTSAELPSTTPSSANTVIVSSGEIVVPGTSVPFPTGAQNQTTAQPTVDSSAVYVPTSSEVSPAQSSASSTIVSSVGTGIYPSIPVGTGSSPSSSAVVPVGTGSSPSSSVVVPVGTGSFPSASTGVYANSTIVSSATTSSASSPIPSADCPGTVPSCLNTYLHNTNCSSNADADCYCKDEDFINSVYQCIDAYGGSDENVSQAMSYMVGICAKAIPSNPAIITAVPSTIDIQPTSSTVNAVTGSLSSAVPVASSDVPAGSLTSDVPASSATDSIVYVTDVVKSTLTTCPIGATISTAGSTTVLTAPSVIATEITTESTITASIISSITGALPSGESAYETSPVETSAGQASPSETAPVETSSASVHVQVPVTVTLFSTQIATITSCAPEVTNCPARESTTLVPTASSVSSIWIPVTSAQETSPSETSPVETSPAESVPAASSGVYSGIVSTAVQVPTGSSPASSAQETSPVQNTSAQESSPVETAPAVSSSVSSGVVSSAAELPSPSSPASSAAFETSPAETTPAVSSAPSVPKTVTLFSTKIDTITSCAEDVTNCPAITKTSLIATGVTTAPSAYETGAVPASSAPAVPEVQSTVIITDVVKTTITTCPIGATISTAGSTTVLTAPSVITSQITIKSTISTTVPAQTQTVVSPESSSADAVMPSSVTSAPAVPAAPKTLTIYSSVVATITSCAADVTNCPASSTVISTSFYAVGTTVSEASSVPAITGSEIAPATTAPAVVPSTPVQPMTTITYSSELVVPATYTAGESQGATIPNSKTTSTIHRTLTVPQVQFITATVSGKPTVGLTYPSAVPATTTPEAVPTSPIADAATPAVSAPAVSAASSGFAPKSSTLASTYNVPAKPTGSPISYTGAGTKVSGSFAAFALAAVAAIFVL
ncbi:hypothetical protein E4T52_07585 [Aureobasidium sp. EXF-3400]|nr:hypothetical protein E4T51_06451 [Aureobasidium sp. EXF-12344]KAI4777499.1 hypothetical protein E4T52_07585 [Aureobasidium sp. EXF-3400]